MALGVLPSLQALEAHQGLTSRPPRLEALCGAAQSSWSSGVSITSLDLPWLSYICYAAGSK